MLSYLAGCLCLGVASAIYYENKNVPAVLPQDQFFHYVSRPDFLVPRWHVTTFDRERLSRGYWFTAPYDELGAEATTKPYVGPFIYDDNGELIWGAGSRFRNADAFDFRVTHINGVPHLTFISLLDKAAVIMNQQYQILSRFPMQRAAEMPNMHEFHVIEDSAWMFYNNKTQAPLDMSRDAGVKDGRCNVMTQSIVEFDITSENHTKKWEWHLMDHIPLNESNRAIKEIDDECKKKHDFLHANSIDKCPDGDILMSVRNTDTIYKINQTTGEIQWRLGGVSSTIDHEGFIFTRQHNAGCQSANETHTVITLLDNANGEYDKYSNEYSRGMLITVDTVNKKARLEAEYAHPFKKVQVARGNCEMLSGANGNIFMGWSFRSLISEHASNGETLLQAQTVPDWLVTYRSYKSPWIGLPNVPPDVVSRLAVRKASDNHENNKRDENSNGDNNESNQNGENHDNNQANDANRDSNQSTDANRDNNQANDANRDNNQSTDANHDNNQTNDDNHDSNQANDENHDNNQANDDNRENNQSNDENRENNQINDDEESGSSIKTEVFASWNGATEVRYWSLYKTDAEGKTQVLLATVPRNGFETQLVYEGFASYVKVKALDANHNVLEHGETSVIKTSVPEVPEDRDLAAEFQSAMAIETQWLQVKGYREGINAHPWVLKVRESSGTPGVMFAAGILANTAALVLYKVYLRLTTRRPSWWLQSPYLPK